MHSLVHSKFSCQMSIDINPFILSVPGSVDVPVDSLEMGVEVEKWYPVTMESNKTNGGEASSIRLRFKYQVYFFL